MEGAVEPQSNIAVTVQLITLLFLSFALLMVYIRLADRWNIIDRPNERSSHITPVIRGGGIIVPLIFLIALLLFPGESVILAIALFAVAAISFMDDLGEIPTRIRIIVHLLAVTGLLWHLGLLAQAGWWLPLYYVLIIGWINAFNFMDGINGITVLYALSVLTSIIAVYLLNVELNAAQEMPLILSVVAALLAFGFFNIRKRARCFAGDVGSVPIAFLIALFLLPLLLNEHWSYIGFLLLYGIDTVITILHRLIKRENIFEAHRSHLYQYLANEMRWGHLKVSWTYFAIQSLISALIIITLQSGQSDAFVFWIIALPVLGFYLFSRWKVVITINRKKQSV